MGTGSGFCFLLFLLGRWVMFRFSSAGLLCLCFGSAVSFPRYFFLRRSVGFARPWGWVFVLVRPFGLLVAFQYESSLLWCFAL